jgi:hypothetical protein
VRSMSPANTWKCPGCGAEVALPAYCCPTPAGPDTERVDQLARALCGCWAADLSDCAVTRLLGSNATAREIRHVDRLGVLGTGRRQAGG